MKKVMKITAVVVIGGAITFGVMLAALHTVVELLEYYGDRYHD